MATKRSKTVRLVADDRAKVTRHFNGKWVDLRMPCLGYSLRPKEAREIGQALLDLADVVEQDNAND